MARAAKVADNRRRRIRRLVAMPMSKRRPWGSESLGPASKVSSRRNQDGYWKTMGPRRARGDTHARLTEALKAFRSDGEWID